MKTKAQINDSIAELQPAPAGETLEQIAVRAAYWLLGTIEDEHEAIAIMRGLYARAIAGDMPSDAEWQANIDSLYDARARDLALDLVRALARALDLDLDLARALARALDLARARDLALALRVLLGDRLATIERLDAAILAAVEHNGNALDMSSYHQCETTHCRAGWAITLHPMGRKLEAAFGPWLAGAVIYQASTGRVPDFFASNAVALADIRQCAAA